MGVCKGKRKDTLKGKEQRCGMTTNSIWKYNKSQLWIIGFVQLFHISGVYVRVVSSTVFSNSWITVLILTQRQLWGQAKWTWDGSEWTWTLLLAHWPTPTGPHVHGSTFILAMRASGNEQNIVPRCEKATPLSSLHPNSQILPEPPSFLDTSYIKRMTNRNSLCCVTTI